MGFEWKKQAVSYDDRRNIAIPGDVGQTLAFCAEHFLGIGNEAIEHRGVYSVALSGGSTPKALFQLLSTDEYRSRIDWKKVLLFWSDERCVSKDDLESNYRMAMEAGFSSLPIPQENIHRMPGDAKDIEEAALEYETLIEKVLPGGLFDLVMLGMGDDGHTASLFPKTHGLHAEDRWVIANFIPQKNVWRLSLTFECINASRHIVIYVIGKGKASMVKEVLSGKYDPDNLPSQRIGTREHKALWVMDSAAAELLRRNGNAKPIAKNGR